MILKLSTFKEQLQLWQKITIIQVQSSVEAKLWVLRAFWNLIAGGFHTIHEDFSDIGHDIQLISPFDAKIHIQMNVLVTQWDNLLIFTLEIPFIEHFYAKKHMDSCQSLGYSAQ